MTLKFRMVGGDSKNLKIKARDSDGNALPLVGASSVKWQLIDHITGAVLVTKTLGSGITITDADEDFLTVPLIPADTTGLEGDYIHESEVIDASGDTLTPRENQKLDDGILTIKKKRIT